MSAMKAIKTADDSETFSGSSSPLAKPASAARRSASHAVHAFFIGASPRIRRQHQVRCPSLMSEMSGRPGSSL